MENKQKYTIIVLSENTPGVLYRIAGILLRRKINIEGIHFSHGESDQRAKFTIDFYTEPGTFTKVVNQIKKIIEVSEVSIE